MSYNYDFHIDKEAENFKENINYLSFHIVLSYSDKEQRQNSQHWAHSSATLTFSKSTLNTFFIFIIFYSFWSFLSFFLSSFGSSRMISSIVRNFFFIFMWWPLICSLVLSTPMKSPICLNTFMLLLLVSSSPSRSLYFFRPST